MASIHITGPDVFDLVAEAWAVYRRVTRGEWEVVVELFPDGWNVDLDRVAQMFGDMGRVAAKPELAAQDPESVTGDDDRVTWTGDVNQLRQAMDLYMRLHMGQFRMLREVTDGWTDFDAEVTRHRLQREGAWPAHPHTSWSPSDSRLPNAVRHAHDIWKLLGGGIQDRSLLTHEIKVFR